MPASWWTTGLGEVVGGVIDVNHNTKEPVKIPLDAGWMNRFLGIDIPESQMVEILRKLEIPVENGMVIAPSFRADLESKADVAEEIARIYGYNNIPTTSLTGLAEGSYTPRQQFDRKTIPLCWPWPVGNHHLLFHQSPAV